MVPLKLHYRMHGDQAHEPKKTHIDYVLFTDRLRGFRLVAYALWKGREVVTAKTTKQFWLYCCLHRRTLK